MSDPSITAQRGRPGPPWLAALGGWLTATTLGWIALLVYLEYDNRRLDEGHMFEGDGAVRPPALFTGDWLQDAVVIYSRMALIALAYAVPLLLVIVWLERRSRRSLGAWLLGGLAAMAPLILAWQIIVLLSPHPAWSIFVLPSLLLAIFGMIGGSVARRVRRRVP